MAQMVEAKVIQIQDGVYNGTYKVGDEINFDWITKTDSFKNYFDNYAKNDLEDESCIYSLDKWEIWGTLKGWTKECLLLDLEVDKVIEIPITDINCIWM